MKLNKPTDLFFPEYLGIPDDSINVLDSSKLGDARRCLRYYFFRHFLGWCSIYPNLDLVFGQAWHIAVEYVWKHGIDDMQIYVEAFTFAQEYILKYYSLQEDVENHPKSMGGIKNGLFSMFENRHIWKDCVYLNSETWGDLILEQERSIRFRLDLTVFDHSLNKIMVIDHKTSKSNSYLYKLPYHTAFQLKCYIFAGKSYYGADKVGGLWINKSVFQKTKVDHERILILPSDEILHQWQLQAIDEYDIIMEEYEKLVTYDHPDNSCMRSFRQNEGGCIAYQKPCPYFDICSITPNPLKIKEVPDGFQRKFWKPEDSNLE